MRTYREFCLLAEAASASNVRSTRTRLAKLKRDLANTPDTPQYANRRKTLQRAIADLQRKLALEPRESRSKKTLAQRVKKHTPESIRAAVGRARAFGKYTGAGIASRIALGAIGLG